MKDSISTSVTLKIFENIESATIAHIFKSKRVKLDLSLFRNVDNFNPARLQKSATTAYPIDNRPRGESDINSVIYHQDKLQHHQDITPIWLVQQNDNYTLLDGAHRIVASFIEDKHEIDAYVIGI